MNNPGAITDELLDRIERLLQSYDAALDSVLYKHFNPTKDQKEIREVLDAINFARHGESDDDLMRSVMEFDQ